jgi:hypothetical protein
MPDASPEDVLFEILAAVVHEFQHHEDVLPKEKRTPPVVFRLELRAHAREFLWRADWGDTGWLEDHTVHAPLGFASGFATISNGITASFRGFHDDVDRQLGIPDAHGPVFTVDLQPIFDLLRLGVVGHADLDRHRFVPRVFYDLEVDGECFPFWAEAWRS